MRQIFFGPTQASVAKDPTLCSKGFIKYQYVSVLCLFPVCTWCSVLFSPGFFRSLRRNGTKKSRTPRRTALMCCDVLEAPAQARRVGTREMGPAMPAMALRRSDRTAMRRRGPRLLAGGAPERSHSGRYGAIGCDGTRN